MFKTILWATDGSDTAARALPFALGLAKADDAKLVVAHVREIAAARRRLSRSRRRDGAAERIIRQVEDLKRAASLRRSSFARPPRVTRPARSRRSPRRTRPT